MTAVAEQPAQEIPWWVVLIQGISAFLLGVFLLVNPVATAVTITWFIGLYWLIAGIFSIIGIFTHKGESWGWALFSGIIGILAGLAILRGIGFNPFITTLVLSTTFVIVLGIWGMIIGVVNLVQAFKGGGWGVGILGVLSIIFGLLLVSSPYLAALAVPMVFGIFGIVGGVIAIIAAFRLRRA